MKRKFSSTATATILGALILATSPAISAPTQAGANTPLQLAHGMGQGASGPVGPGSMMGPGMMGRRAMPCPGMTGQGAGQGMGQGMGHGMMGPGVGKGPGLGSQVVPSKDLTADDVRHFLDHRLEMHGNKRLKVGDVNEADDDKIVADITTVDGSLVQRLEVDRHTGKMKHVQ